MYASQSTMHKYFICVASNQERERKEDDLFSVFSFNFHYLHLRPMDFAAEICNGKYVSQTINIT